MGGRIMDLREGRGRGKGLEAGDAGTGDRGPERENDRGKKEQATEYVTDTL